MERIKFIANLVADVWFICFFVTCAFNYIAFDTQPTSIDVFFILIMLIGYAAPEETKNNVE